MLFLGLACSRFGTDTADPSDPSDAAVAGQDAAATEPDAGEHPVVRDDAGNVLSRADAYAKSVLEDGAIAYWRCRQEGASSVSSEVGSPGNDAMLGTAGPKQRAGGLFPNGGECDFGGTNGEIAGAANVPFLGSGDFTIEAWFKPSAAPDDKYRHLFEQADNVPAGTARGAIGLFLRHDSDLGNDTLSAEQFTVNPDAHRVIHVPMPSLNQWHHIVMMQGPQLFIDGAAIGSAANEGDVVTFNRRLLWGAKSIQDDPSVVGALTELAVYQVSLSSERIAAHYALGKQ